MNMGLILSIFACALHWFSFSPRRQFLRPWADGGLGLSFGFQTYILCAQTLQTGSLPYSNLYGSLLFLSCVLTWFLVFYGFQNGYPRTQMGLSYQAFSDLRFESFGNLSPWHPTNSLKPNFRWTSFAARLNPAHFKFQTANMHGTLKQNAFPNCFTLPLQRKMGCDMDMYRIAVCILSPTVPCLHAFCVFLPPGLKKTSALIPALQSHWLEMHVGSMLTSYALLFCGGLFAAGYLVSQKVGSSYLPRKKGSSDPSPPAKGLMSFGFVTPKTNLSLWFDMASYRMIGFGFSFLTLGLVSGAVWANETWGSFWSWDVKETWALISWLVFAMYLHTRLFKGWRGASSAWFAIWGWVCLWITFLGVNVFSKGLHVYGFLR